MTITTRWHLEFTGTRRLESAHSAIDSDVVKEIWIPVSYQIAKTITYIRLDNAIGILRIRSVGWVVNAIHDITK